MKNLLAIGVLTTVLLSSCQSSSTPKGAVESYLKAMKAGNSQALQELQCIKTATRPADSLTNVKSWKVTEVKERVDETDADSQYSLVSVKIEADSAVGGSVTRTWNFDVWNSDELFDHQRRAMDRVQQTLNQGYATINQVRQFTGGEQVAAPSPLPMPERGEITSKPYCVVAIQPL